MENDDITLQEKNISIIERNNLKKEWWFLLFELHSFIWNKNKHKPHKKVFENKDFWGVTMPSEDTPILEFKSAAKTKIW